MARNSIKAKQAPETFWHHIYKHIEFFVDRAVPFFILLLFAIIICEVAFPAFFDSYISYFDMAYYLIMIFLIADLIFKYLRIRDFKEFFRGYWIDIIAVFPFYLIFRFLEGSVSFIRASELVRESQVVLHEGLEVEKVIAGETKLLKGAQIAARETSMVSRALSAVTRSPQLLRARVFFKHVKKHKHNKKRNKR